MSDVTLHIGVPKTGTTSIQRQLYADAPRLLDEGVLVPRLWGSNHMPIAFYAAQEPFRTGMTKRLAITDQPAAEQQIREVVASFPAEAPRCILTSEFLFELNTPEEITRLRDLMSVFAHVRILVYVRRQDHMFQSEISQRIRSGQADEATAMRFGIDRYRLHERLIKWRAVFGADSVEVVDHGHAGANVVADFYRRTGLTEGRRARSRFDNRSLDAVKLTLLLRFNRIANRRPDAAALRKQFTTLLETLPALGGNFQLPAAEVARIARLVNPSNERLQQEFGLKHPFKVSVEGKTGPRLDAGLSGRAVHECYPRIVASLQEMGFDPDETAAVTG